MVTVEERLKRPVMRYHGGKWRIAPWIISEMPEHRTYVEPFGGAASVLLRKPRSYAEVYNDLDDEIVNLFRVLRDPAAAARLAQLVRLTPFSRSEFRAAYEPGGCPLERARRTVVRAGMGFGSAGATATGRTGFRSCVLRSGTHPGTDWAGQPVNLVRVSARLAGVVIECRPALDVLRYHDHENTFFYVDPPYLPECRSGGSKDEYRHEMTHDDHVRLLSALLDCRGRVMVSGYGSGLYDGMLAGWRRVSRRALADSAAHRTEVLWMNYGAGR